MKVLGWLSYVHYVSNIAYKRSWLQETRFFFVLLSVSCNEILLYYLASKLEHENHSRKPPRGVTGMPLRACLNHREVPVMRSEAGNVDKPRIIAWSKYGR